MILANGVFAGAEIALVALRMTRLRELLERGHGGARAAIALKSEPERLLATVQIGITVVSATAAAFGGASLAERLAPLIAEVPSVAKYAEQIALGVVVAIVSYLSIVIGELVPKSLALRSAEQYALLVSRPLLAVAWLARPLVWLLTQTSNLLLKPLGDRTTFTETRHSPEEIQQLVEEAMQSGSLHPHAAQIASRALDFHELIASEVMVPRQDLIMIPANANMAELSALIGSHPHTRIPVYDGSRDNVTGYVHIKDLATQTWRDGTVKIETIRRTPFFVPDSKPAADLLREMQEKRLSLAIVVDEQGGVAGIITVTDLVEEVVGEMFSEHERDKGQLTRDATGTATVPGTMPIRELNRALELDLPDGDWNTIAGLCIALAGRIPAGGEKITLQTGVVAEVADASPRRIRSVRIHVTEPQPGHEHADPSAKE